MSEKSAEAILRSFGFTEMEARVYCYLLVHAPVTGYRVAKGIGKATANVYAAIETLRIKGAIDVDESESRLCRAAPPSELIGKLKARFEQDSQRAEKELLSLYNPQIDNRIYQITDLDQVLSHARQLILGATETLVLDIFPTPLEHLKHDLAAALERGVKVTLRHYDKSTQIDGAVMASSTRYAQQAAQWPGQQLNLVADARHALLALFDRHFEKVIQAVVSQSHYLSNLMHSAIIAEITWAQSSHLDIKDTKLEAIRSRSLLNAQPPGYYEFLDLMDTEKSSASEASDASRSKGRRA